MSAKVEMYTKMFCPYCIRAKSLLESKGGDIIDIPTGIFRGFENIGTDYGMIMAVLGVLVGGLIIAMYLPIFQLGSVV